MKELLSHQKLNTTPACILVLLLLVSCSSRDEIPEVFHQYVVQARSNVENIQVYPQTIEQIWDKNYSPNCPDSITENMAFRDIDHFQYLIETAYSGKAYWEQKGFSFDDAFEEVRSKVEKVNGDISVGQFQSFLVAVFEGKVIDGHFNIWGTSNHSFYKHKDVYFTDVLVNRTDDENYIVIDSKVESVSRGSVFEYADIKSYLFRTLSPVGSEHYLLGTLAYENISDLSLILDGTQVKLPLHRSRITKAQNRKAQAFSVDTLSGVPVLRLASLLPTQESMNKLLAFEEMGLELRDQDIIILDLYDNSGGTSTYAKHFIQNLNGVAHSRLSTAQLRSPAISEYFAAFDMEKYPEFVLGLSKETLDELMLYRELHEKYLKHPMREWDFRPAVNEMPEGDYNGKLIVLMNARVGSAAENAVDYSKSVKNTIFVGENTGGIGTFAAVFRYHLPHSGIAVQLAREIHLTPDFEETVGYMPHFWLDTHKPIQELIKWLNNPDQYQFEFDVIPRFKVRFEVISKRFPEETVYISGNHSELGEWSPDAIPLESSEYGHWNRVFDFELRTELYYKFTRGSWRSEVVKTDGVVPRSSRLIVEHDTTITMIVKEWKDMIDPTKLKYE